MNNLPEVFSQQDVQELPFFFIVGRGRSGTTLLQMMLNAQGKVTIPLESKFILHLQGKYEGRSFTSPLEIRQFCEDLYTNRKFRLFWNVEKEALITFLSGQLPVRGFPEICKLIYAYAPTPFPFHNLCMLGDKNPFYSLYIPALLRTFPEARFVHLIRDARANVWSHYKAFGKKNAVHMASQWKLYNQRVEAAKREKPDRFHTLRYEDLVSNPEETLRSLCTFLNLAYSPAMLDYHLTADKWAKESSYLNLKHHLAIGKKVSPAKAGGWKEGLTSFEVRCIEHVAYEELLRYGYPVEKQSLASSALLYWAMGKIRFHIQHLLIQKVLFSMPFSLRKHIFNGLSLFFDARYTGSGTEQA